jgi:type III restriction enzyme
MLTTIEASTTEYSGTKEFNGHSVCAKVDEKKTSDILIVGDDKEFGTFMSETTNADLHLNLKNHNWYMYDDNLGTSEEKYFIQFIRQAMDHLEKKYKDIYFCATKVNLKYIVFVMDEQWSRICSVFN